MTVFVVQEAVTKKLFKVDNYNVDKLSFKKFGLA